MTAVASFLMLILAYANAGCAAWMVSLGHYGGAAFNALIAIILAIQSKQSA